NNGGTLAARIIQPGAGAANRTINWNDGTITNYDASTDLTIGAGPTLALDSMGTHTFNIQSGLTANVAAVMADATTGGTLTKTGAGTLNLNASNTYTGLTTILAGTLGGSGTITGDVALMNNATINFAGGTIAGNLTATDGGNWTGKGTVAGTATIAS